MLQRVSVSLERVFFCYCKRRCTCYTLASVSHSALNDPNFTLASLWKPRRNSLSLYHCKIHATAPKKNKNPKTLACTIAVIVLKDDKNQDSNQSAHIKVIVSPILPPCGGDRANAAYAQLQFDSHQLTEDKFII